MASTIRQTLINELSELSLSLSDGLERIGEFEPAPLPEPDTTDPLKDKHSDENEVSSAKSKV